MNSRLVRQLQAFLDLQSHGDLFAEEALFMGYARLGEEKSSKLFELDRRLIALGQKTAFAQLRSRTLLAIGLERNVASENEYIREVAFTGTDEPGKSTFGWFMSRYVGDSEWRKMITLWAESEGISPDDLILQLVDESAARDEEDRLAFLGSPNFERQFVRHLAAQIENITEKAISLEDLTYTDILSDELRGLFQEAHYSYLYGLEASSAIMCGAILEEAFRKKYGFGGNTRLILEDMFFDALKDGIISQETFAMADEIKKMRNLAAHNPKKFKMQSDAIKATVLSNTRLVVKELLAGEIGL